MEKSRLQKTISEIGNRISEIESSGEIAPSGVWISKYVVPKNKGKKYFYYRLMESTDNRSCSGKTQGKFKQYLGKKNSSKYNKWVSAISRRNRIKSLLRQKQVLELQLQKLEALEKVSSGNSTQANSQSELVIKDFSHVQQIIADIETQINELNHQFQFLLNYATHLAQNSA